MKKFLSDVLVDCNLTVSGTTSLGAATGVTVSDGDNSLALATTAWVTSHVSTNSIYSLSVPSGTTTIRLASASATDDVSITAAGSVAVSRVSDSEIRLTGTNNYLSSASFNTTNGVLTLGRQGLSDITVDLDNRYLTSESDTLDTVTSRDGVTTNTIGVGTVNVTGSTAGAELLTVDGTYGRLFTVTDDLSDSLFSVNTVAGLPAFEVFADNTIKIGAFANPITIDSSSNISIPGTITASGYNDSNWNTAFNDRITAAAVSGTTTKTLTLTQGDGSTITASWTDIEGSGADGYVSNVALNGNSLDFTAVGSGFAGSIDLSTITTDLTSVETVYSTVHNVSGAPIQKGTPLAVVPGQTSGNVSDVIPADASDPSRMPAVFIAKEDIADGVDGQAVVFGEITGIDTSGYDSGVTVYVAPGGGWTVTKPDGANLIQNLGIITKVHNTNGAGVVMGAGRSNDVPNIPTGYAWVGDANQVATPTLLGSAAYVATSTFAPASHNHDDRYYTETEADARFVNVTGDTINGNLTISGGDGDVALVLESDVNNANEAWNPLLHFKQDGGNINGYIGLNGEQDALWPGAPGNGMYINPDEELQIASNSVPVANFTLGQLEVLGTVIATGGNSDEWNTAFSWGDHSGLYDNYGSWNLKTNGVQRTTVQSGGTLDIKAGTNVTVSYGAGGVVTISSTDTNTDTNNYLTGLSFNTTNGILTATRQGLGDLTVDLDGRYLTSFTESDPVFAASPAGGIEAEMIDQWNSAFAWGDHSGAGYLTSYTETDPIFSAHVSSGITATKISNWDTAHSWGNHASAGYLTSETRTELSLASNILSYRDEAGVVTELDLSLYLDDTNLARLTSGTLNGTTGIATFTRDDNSTFTVDFSAFLADANNYADVVSFNTSTGVLTIGRNGSLSDLTVDLDGRFLTSFTETDPIFSASPAAGITPEQITNWDVAHSWGDHGTVGYLTSVPAEYVTATEITNYSISPRFGSTIGMGNDSAVIEFQDSNSYTKATYWTNLDAVLINGDGNSNNNIILRTGNILVNQNQFISGKLGVNTRIEFSDDVASAMYQAGGTGDPAATVIETFDSAVNIGAFLDFTIYNTGKDSMRSGTLQLVFNADQVMFNEVNTMDIGDTTPCTLTAVNNAGIVEVHYTTPDPSYHIKYHVRTL